MPELPSPAGVVSSEDKEAWGTQTLENLGILLLMILWPTVELASTCRSSMWCQYWDSSQKSWLQLLKGT